MARTAQEEAKQVLPSGHPGGCVAYLAMEINGAEFSQCPVAVAAVLSGSAARSPSILSCSSHEELNEQLVRENWGLSSTSVPATQFLQERRIAPQGMVRVIAATGTRANQRMAPVAAATELPLGESSRESQSLDERGVSFLEKRRVELELRAGGDHDLPYRFTLPIAMPQVLAWMKLLARVQNGDIPR